MNNPLLTYILPSLFVGALGGFFVGDVVSNGASSKTKRVTQRAAFLSSEDDEIDYQKLARVCLTAGSRSTGASALKVSPRAPQQAQAELSDREIDATKESLDRVMTATLESGIWTRDAAFYTRNMLRRLPASDVADFERLLNTTLDNGDLKPQVGAWTPAQLN